MAYYLEGNLRSVGVVSNTKKFPNFFFLSWVVIRSSYSRKFETNIFQRKIVQIDSTCPYRSRRTFRILTIKSAQSANSILRWLRKNPKLPSRMWILEDINRFDLFAYSIHLTFVTYKENQLNRLGSNWWSGYFNISVKLGSSRFFNTKGRLIKKLTTQFLIRNSTQHLKLCSHVCDYLLAQPKRQCRLSLINIKSFTTAINMSVHLVLLGWLPFTSYNAAKLTINKTTVSHTILKTDQKQYLP